MDGFEVIPEELHAHASAVDGVASGVGQATSAGATATGFTPNAFGIICSFFTPPSLTASGIGLEALSSQQGMLTALATTLPGVADDYSSTDGNVTSTMSGVEAKL